MSNREVMQQALEALQYGKPNKAITILREALEQPEPDRWQWIFEDKHGDRYTHKNLFYTAAEAAESARICGVKAIKKTGEAKVTAAPPAAQPEPTPWRDMVVVTLVREGINKHKARELADHFAAQPAAQRKPLTDEELDALAIDEDGLPNSHLEFARAIEAAHNIKEGT
jgi:hypothetical protein